MEKFDRDIDAALLSGETIPRDTVLLWIDAAVDLVTLSKLYRLTDEGYYRIQPELDKESTCGLIQRYLLECIRRDVRDSAQIENRFDASQSLLSWLFHLLDMDDTSEIIAGAARAITDLFLESDEAVRYTIETAVLEHALETEALRPYFAHWESDDRLKDAWVASLEWGKAHPDSMRNMFRRLTKPSDE
jgi:hypothetical protein